ncbi:hypothetical protein AtNW77_Chr5g0115291 [Arabidopsis thaliana]
MFIFDGLKDEEDSEQQTPSAFDSSHRRREQGPIVVHNHRSSLSASTRLWMMP